MSYSDAKKRFMHVALLLFFLIFSTFYRVAHAQLSEKECSAKWLKMITDGMLNTSGKPKKDNVLFYNQWSDIKNMYQGECAHVNGASTSLKSAEESLQKVINDCIVKSFK